ncbi:MAG: TRIC cation channel family protein [Dermatophilus congolensis]|nr:TRIC cation channel family protein [Dermatophilus congolensis]
MSLLDPDVLFRVVDVTGVFANGLLGGAVARSKGFDMIGFIILAISSGLGGGMIRDLMLGVSFPVALTDPLYLSTAVVGAAVAFLLDLDGQWKRLLLVADVLALGCWSATGAAKASAAGLDWMPAIMLGVITAVGGGMLRDIMVNEVPGVFGGTPLYATLSIVASAQMVVMYQYGQHQLGMGIAILLCAVFGLLARKRNWMLPGAASIVIRTPRIPGARMSRSFRRRPVPAAEPAGSADRVEPAPDPQTGPRADT